jgi:hypothetical protein
LQHVTTVLGILVKLPSCLFHLFIHLLSFAKCLFESCRLQDIRSQLMTQHVSPLCWASMLLLHISEVLTMKINEGYYIILHISRTV